MNAIQKLAAVCAIICTLLLHGAAPATAQRYTMTLTEASATYNMDYMANTDWIWINDSITSAGWRLDLNLSEANSGGNLYGLEITGASLAGNPAMTRISAADGYAIEWTPVSNQNPVGIWDRSFGLSFRYASTDKYLPWRSTPRYPFQSQASLQLQVWVTAYTKPPDPVFGYSGASRVDFYFNWTIKAPKY